MAGVGVRPWGHAGVRPSRATPVSAQHTPHHDHRAAARKRTRIANHVALEVAHGMPCHASHSSRVIPRGARRCRARLHQYGAATPMIVFTRGAKHFAAVHVSCHGRPNPTSKWRHPDSLIRSIAASGSPLRSWRRSRGVSSCDKPACSPRAPAETQPRRRARRQSRHRLVGGGRARREVVDAVEQRSCIQGIATSSKRAPRWLAVAVAVSETRAGRALRDAASRCARLMPHVSVEDAVRPFRCAPRVSDDRAAGAAKPDGRARRAHQRASAAPPPLIVCVAVRTLNASAFAKRAQDRATRPREDTGI